MNFDFTSLNLWITHLAQSHSYWVYFALVFLGFVEGPFLSFFCGILLNYGYIAFLPVYTSLMLGDLIGDGFWYYLGRVYGHRFIKRFGKYFNITDYNVLKVSDFFHRHKHKILFISKSTSGFGFALATLFAAGMVRIPFGKYMIINFLGQFIWTAFLLAAGFYFSNIFFRVSDVFNKVFLIILFALCFVAFLRFRKYLQNKVAEV